MLKSLFALLVFSSLPVHALSLAETKSQAIADLRLRPQRDLTRQDVLDAIAHAKSQDLVHVIELVAATASDKNNLEERELLWYLDQNQDQQHARYDVVSTPTMGSALWQSAGLRSNVPYALGTSKLLFNDAELGLLKYMLKNAKQLDAITSRDFIYGFTSAMDHLAIKEYSQEQIDAIERVITRNTSSKNDIVELGVIEALLFLSPEQLKPELLDQVGQMMKAGDQHNGRNDSGEILRFIAKSM